MMNFSQNRTQVFAFRSKVFLWENALCETERPHFSSLCWLSWHYDPGNLAGKVMLFHLDKNQPSPSTVYISLAKTKQWVKHVPCALWTSQSKKYATQPRRGCINKCTQGNKVIHTAITHHSTFTSMDMFHAYTYTNTCTSHLHMIEHAHSYVVSIHTKRLQAAGYLLHLYKFVAKALNKTISPAKRISLYLGRLANL